MRTFKRQPDNRRSVYLKLVGEIEGQLRQAYAKRHEQGLETQAGLAKKLDVDRSVIHRRLTGRTNMTIQTVADLVWALGYCIAVSISDADESGGNQHRVLPTFELGDAPKAETPPPILSGRDSGAQGTSAMMPSQLVMAS